MEYPFLLIVAALILCEALLIGLYWTVKTFFSLCIRSKVFTGIALAAAGTVTVFFPIAGVLTLSAVLFAGVFGRKDSSRKTKRFWAQTVFALILCGIYFIYFPSIYDLWQAGEGILSTLFKVNDKVNVINFFEMFYFIRFFRDIYPALIAGIVYMAFLNALNQKPYPLSGWYRFMRSFDHRQSVLLILSLVLAMLFVLFGTTLNLSKDSADNINRVLLNSALYFLIPYTVYGVVTILYYLYKKKHWAKYPVLFIFLIIPVFSGPAFLVPIAFFIGVGVSDIWMGYFSQGKRSGISGK